MELVVYNIKGEPTSKKVELNDEIFAIQPNDHAIYLDVNQYRANQRQGTHSSTERADIIGSTKKIKKQKGTGTARAGDVKSPLFRGGGRIFGPHPRDYWFKLNKKLKKVARKSALAYKASENGITIIEDFIMDVPKTSQYKEILDCFNLSEKRTLLILSQDNKNIYLSARNLKKSKVINASGLNTFEILKANNMLICESSLKEIEKMFE